ncbi:iron chelate uptake ABC transporter family permease subunit [Nesterenkonia sp. HG001]|uniref:iron chelate uptake ABC transporter family permease subunit n=1 Tax=Nesterenkonia sp. HG001 TaxID=2983207 RepID=UPI002AC5AFE4|nr:iron chelate uptake ABC transporter family permease subunit [Nesterenkonia sp. HG001]MDZ5078999.1 iron chelate uptake ABC transporter family permease subunit [Nesterenkonia sp. HG001]
MSTTRTSTIPHTSPSPSPSARRGAEASPSLSPPQSPAAPTPTTAFSAVRRSAALVALVIALAVAVLLSIAVGSKEIPLGTVLESFWSFDPTVDEHFIIREMRLPRAAAGIAVGAALAVAGALIQALTRNPLADPGILGVSSGAAFFVALSVGVFGVTAVLGYVWFAFAGALVVTVAVYLIGSAGGGTPDPLRLTLAGVALGAVLAGITTGMVLLNPVAFDQMRQWNAGTIAGRGYDTLLPVLPFLLIGLLLALSVAAPLNSIALGEDLAVSLGTRIGLVRVAVIAAVTLLAGGATAIAGPILFVGLMVPHIARWITGPEQRWILAFSIVLGPLLLVVADTLGRVVMRPGELPVGIVTAFVGAPLLILLARRRKASRL